MVSDLEVLLFLNSADGAQRLNIQAIQSYVVELSSRGYWDSASGLAEWGGASLFLERRCGWEQLNLLIQKKSESRSFKCKFLLFI